MAEDLKILFVANWPLRRKASDSDYAFFSHFTSRPKVSLMGTPRLSFLQKIEKTYLRFYLITPLIAFFRSFFYDVVIAYSSQVGLPLALLLRLTQRKKTRLVVFDVETFGRVHYGLRYKMVKAAVERIDRVVFASSRQKEFYERYGFYSEKKFRYIPIGIGPYEKTMPLSAQGNGPVVAPGHHGRAFRDWATLLRAWRLSGAGKKILIAGKEGLSDEDREGEPIPEGFLFERFLPINEFQTRIENAPFVVLPLPERGQSLGQLTVLFCMAMGKAVVGTRVMGIEDYVEEGVTGFLVPPGDAKAMAEAISRLFENPVLAVQMGSAAHDRVVSLFNDRVMGQAWDKTVRELL